MGVQVVHHPHYPLHVGVVLVQRSGLVPLRIITRLPWIPGKPFPVACNIEPFFLIPASQGQHGIDIRQ